MGEIFEKVLKESLRQRHEEARSVVAQLDTVRVEHMRCLEVEIVVEGQIAVAVGMAVPEESHILKVVERGQQAVHMAEENR